MLPRLKEREQALNELEGTQPALVDFLKKTDPDLIKKKLNTAIKTIFEEEVKKNPNTHLINRQQNTLTFLMKMTAMYGRTPQLEAIKKLRSNKMTSEECLHCLEAATNTRIREHRNKDAVDFFSKEFKTAKKEEEIAHPTPRGRGMHR